jgi:hypothetical protein
VNRPQSLLLPLTKPVPTPPSCIFQVRLSGVEPRRRRRRLRNLPLLVGAAAHSDILSGEEVSTPPYPYPSSTPPHPTPRAPSSPHTHTTYAHTHIHTHARTHTHTRKLPLPAKAAPHSHLLPGKQPSPHTALPLAPTTSAYIHHYATYGYHPLPACIATHRYLLELLLTLTFCPVRNPHQTQTYTHYPFPRPPLHTYTTPPAATTLHLDALPPTATCWSCSSFSPSVR